MGTAMLVRYRMAVVLLTAALLATLTVALTGGDRADAVDGPVEVVYVATGRNFPDALAGSTLATSVGAPLLTVEPVGPLPQATVDALQALDPNVIIVFGGPVAVADEVVDALAAYARSGNVTRIEGEDRHDTAAAIADALPNKVHDADLLDGLNSTAFLRQSDADQFLTVDDTIDANTLGGQASAAHKGFGIPIQAAGDIDGGASLSGQTLSLPPTGSPEFTLGWALPGGHVSGDTVTVRLAIQSSPNCAIKLSASGVAGPDDGAQRMLNYGWDLVGPSDDLVNFGPNPQGTSSSVARAEFEIAGRDLGPGAAMNFRLVRLADDPMDTCNSAFVYGGIAVDY